MYDEKLFETEVCRMHTGNMKGMMSRQYLPDSIMLYGAEPDYPTAPCIRSRLADFARNGSYGFTLKTKDYEERICWWMLHMRHCEIDPSWIVPTMGTVFALATALRAFTDEGDGVIIQTPSYFRFDGAIKRNKRIIIPNRLKEKNGVYSIDFTDLEEKMAQPRNKLMVLVNPHNPTGKVFTEDDLQVIAEMAARYHVIIFSDEIFAETAQPGHDASVFATLSSMGITSFSLGKSFGFTGVSQANVLIQDPELREKYTVQRDRDHFGSIDPFFYNAVMAAYTEEGAAWVRSMNEYNRINERRIESRLLSKMPKLRVSPWEGTYIIWIDCRSLDLTDEALKSFMEDAGIIADPGIEYGETGKGFYRWNIATQREKINQSLDRLESAYRELGSISCTEV